MSEKKEFYLIIKGEKVEVSEEVYRAYVRPIRAEQRQKRRNWRCQKKGKKGNLVRCQEDCSQCPYALAGNNATGNVLSLDTFKEEGVEILDRDFDLEEMYIESESQSEEKEQLYKAIQRLPKKQQKVLILTYFKGKDQEFIAKKLQIKQPAVSRLLKRAEERLKILLREK